MQPLKYIQKLHYIQNVQLSSSYSGRATFLRLIGREGDGFHLFDPGELAFLWGGPLVLFDPGGSSSLHLIRETPFPPFDLGGDHFPFFFIIEILIPPFGPAGVFPLFDPRWMVIFHFIRERLQFSI